MGLQTSVKLRTSRRIVTPVTKPGFFDATRQPVEVQQEACGDNGNEATADNTFVIGRADRPRGRPARSDRRPTASGEKGPESDRPARRGAHRQLLLAAGEIESPSDRLPGSRERLHRRDHEANGSVSGGPLQGNARPDQAD